MFTIKYLVVSMSVARFQLENLWSNSESLANKKLRILGEEVADL